ncbi:MAG: aldo/keto reductase [Dictyoglomus sp.]|nr:aldo/keto reductase [Dictyoglomus sp.]MDW8188910.1 aldo/keto reductase [Dictyoglomus sp.]
MKYREMGKLGIKVSILGFGAMRLPTRGSYSDIEEKKAIEMIQYALDHGVNYIDTAYVYHDGQSEVVVGKAVKNGYRDRVYIATKLPVWLLKDKSDMDMILKEQLQRLDTDYIDFYLLHGIDEDSWKKCLSMGALEWGEKMKEKGLIKYFGFSFHDELEVFKKIIDYYNWDFCQIQYNYMDVNFQAGKEGLEYAGKKGIGVVVMEPLKGGILVNPPEEVKTEIENYKIKRSPLEWAFLFIWNHPEVSTVLSGMSNLDQVKENIEMASKAEIGLLTPEELKFIDHIRKVYASIKAIDCTQCRYCMPCPYGVDIPRNFALYNDGVRFKSFRSQWYLGAPWFVYNHEMKPEERAENCRKCGECETKCPQGLPIRELLDKVVRELRMEI